jgi:hypothetical protein
MSRLVLIVLACVGCWTSVIEEATQDRVNPGGKVQAALVGGQMRSTRALATAMGEPMKIEGASAELTFSLHAADSTGGTALQALKMPGDTAQLIFRSGGRNRLEIHLDGGGCVSTLGTVDLSLDSNGEVTGTFDAEGTITGGTNSCHMTGTLADVPVAR